MIDKRFGETRLIVVRHGAPDEGNCLDPGDPPLSSEGRLQAQRLAQLLAAEGIDRIVSSPQRRARQTAEPLTSLVGLSIYSTGSRRLTCIPIDTAHPKR